MKAKQENLLQLPLGLSGPRVRHADPDTSQAAAEALTPKRLTEIQNAVLAWFRAHGPGTDEQIEDALLNRYSGFSTLRKRRCDLVTLGYLRDSGKRETNRNGRQMIVWELIGETHP